MTDFSDIFQVDFLGEAEVRTVDGDCFRAAAVHLSDDGSIPREDSRSIASLLINNSRGSKNAPKPHKTAEGLVPDFDSMGLK